MRAAKTVVCGLVVLLAACQPAPVPTPAATPQVLVVQSTPALAQLSPIYHDCAQELPGVGLVLKEAPASTEPADAGTSLALRWGPGDGPKGYAVVIGQEELVIVVNPKNALTKLSINDLRAVYSGQKHDWSKESAMAGEIQAWGYLSGDDIQQIFEGAVLGGQPAPRQSAYQAPDPAALREAVAANPAAIGFLPRRWLDASVKLLPISGLDAASLRQPILAVSKSEPIGPEKAWIICLQQRLSE